MISWALRRAIDKVELEWNYDASLDWHLFLGEEHSGLQRLVKDINHLYTSRPALHTARATPGITT